MRPAQDIVNLRSVLTENQNITVYAICKSSFGIKLGLCIKKFTSAGQADIPPWNYSKQNVSRTIAPLHIRIMHRFCKLLFYSFLSAHIKYSMHNLVKTDFDDQNAEYSMNCSRQTNVKMTPATTNSNHIGIEL